jgi:hypothetical protein
MQKRHYIIRYIDLIMVLTTAIFHPNILSCGKNLSRYTRILGDEVGGVIEYPRICPSFTKPVLQ